MTSDQQEVSQSSRASSEWRGLRRHLLAIAFWDEFGPFFAVFTLLFDNWGLDTAQISQVFLLWAVTVVVLEAPSGAIADHVDRRLVIIAAFFLRASAMALWLIWPGYWSMMIGAVLWALYDASSSGAWESLIYDELEARGRADAFSNLYARMMQVSHVALALSSGIAIGVLFFGGSLALVGWLTVCVHAVPAVLLWQLPARPPPGATETDTESHWLRAAWRGWWSTLRDGVTLGVRQPHVGRLLVLGGMIEGAFVFDEYVPLLARQRGAPDALVPVLVVCVWLGLIAGSEVAARFPRLRTGALAWALGLGGLTLLVTFWLPHLLTLLFVAIAYGTMQLGHVVASARIQDALDPKVRATASSVAGMLSACLSGGIFFVVGTSSAGDASIGLAHAAWVVPCSALLVARWLPSAKRSANPELGSESL